MKEPTDERPAWLSNSPAPQHPLSSAPTALPEKDNWEISGGVNVEDEVKVEVDALIRYRDGAGQESRRTIRTKYIAPYFDDLVISAHCNARQAHRTFLASRILEFVDLSTGEVVGEPRAHLWRAYETSPLGRATRLIEDLRHEADILLYVGRASGRLTPKKREVILDHLVSNIPERQTLREQLSKLLASDAPTQANFRSSLKALVSSGQAPDRILGAIDRLTSSSKQPDEFTAAAAAYARKRLVPTTKRDASR